MDPRWGRTAETAAAGRWMGWRWLEGWGASVKFPGLGPGVPDAIAAFCSSVSHLFSSDGRVPPTVMLHFFWVAALPRLRSRL